VTYFLKFWDPLHISETVEAKTSNLACRLATGGPKRNNAKLGHKGSRDLLFKFWDPLYISGTVEVRNLKFTRKLTSAGPKRYNAKLGQKGS